MSRLGCICVSLFVCLSVSSAEELHQVLTDAGKNIRVAEWEHQGDGWSIHKQQLHGGQQDGVDVIHVDNGKLQFTVIPTRGMSILEVRSGDLRLGWDSPVKEVVHPKYINLESRGGLGWLAGFNEWMVRCGLEYAGHPGEDRFINNTGDEAKMELTLHGKIGNIPASEVHVVVDDRIRIRGRVDERMFYGTQLELWTEISTEPGSACFTISDRITNRAAAEQEFEIIYHANHGPPLLEKNAKFVGPIERVIPMNDHAAQRVDNYFSYDPPTPGFVEEVYCLTPYANDGGVTTVMLRNAAGNQGVSFTYAVKQLPFLTLWKNTLTEQNGYVTGIEPGTNFPFNRRVEREAGRLQKLPAGESQEFTIEFELLSTADAVQRAATTIDAIRAGRVTNFVREAPKTD
jgi:hypothetical protein